MRFARSARLVRRSRPPRSADPPVPPSAPRSSWYTSSYADVKLLNPRFPFMLRANPEGEPYMFIEYDFGKKVRVELAGLSEAQIDAQLEAAVKAGDAMPRAFYQSVEPLRLPTVVD